MELGFCESVGVEKTQIWNSGVTVGKLMFICMCTHTMKRKCYAGEHMAKDPKSFSLGDWDMDGTSLYGAVIAYLAGGVQIWSHLIFSWLILWEVICLIFKKFIAFHLWTLSLIFVNYIRSLGVTESQKDGVGSGESKGNRNCFIPFPLLLAVMFLLRNSSPHIMETCFLWSYVLVGIYL